MRFDIFDFGVNTFFLSLFSVECRGYYSLFSCILFGSVILRKKYNNIVRHQWNDDILHTYSAAVNNNNHLYIRIPTKYPFAQISFQGPYTYTQAPSGLRPQHQALLLQKSMHLPFRSQSP